MVERVYALFSTGIIGKAAVIFGIALFIVLAFSLLYFLISIFPPKMADSEKPSRYGLDYEEVSFKTSDGLALKGWFIPSKESDATIIVGHGYPFDKSNILPIASFLHPDYNILLFDFRYFGESEGSYTTVGWKEQEDFKAAVAYLKSRSDVSHEKIGAWGFSLSASVMLMANADVKAIVADSPYANLYTLIEDVYWLFPSFLKKPFVWTTWLYGYLFFGINAKKLSPADSVKSINVPVLLIHGENDAQIPLKHSEIIYSSSNKELTELWIVKGAGHGTSYAFNKKEYERKVLDFFDENLK